MNNKINNNNNNNNNSKMKLSIWKPKNQAKIIAKANQNKISNYNNNKNKF